MKDDRIKNIISDCRKAAEVYTDKPGLAGPGANADTICDIYLTIARLAEALNPTALTSGKRSET